MLDRLQGSVGYLNKMTGGNQDMTKYMFSTLLKGKVSAPMIEKLFQQSGRKNPITGKPLTNLDEITDADALNKWMETESGGLKKRQQEGRGRGAKYLQLTEKAGQYGQLSAEAALDQDKVDTFKKTMDAQISGAQTLVTTFGSLDTGIQAVMTAFKGLADFINNNILGARREGSPVGYATGHHKHVGVHRLSDGKK